MTACSYLLAPKKNIFCSRIGTSSQRIYDLLFPHSPRECKTDDSNERWMYKPLLRVGLHDLLSCQGYDFLESDGYDVWSAALSVIWYTTAAKSTHSGIAVVHK